MRKLLLILAIITLLVIGCDSGGDTPTPTVTPPTTPTETPDEEKIQALVDEQIAALNNVDLETVYSQRTPGYRSRVTGEEFQDFIMLAFAQFLPMIESGEAVVEITDLKIRVDGDWAYMTGTLGINGTSIQEYTDDSPDIWHNIDGTWYNVETNSIFPGYDASELPE